MMVSALSTYFLIVDGRTCHFSARACAMLGLYLPDVRSCTTSRTRSRATRLCSWLFVSFFGGRSFVAKVDSNAGRERAPIDVSLVCVLADRLQKPAALGAAIEEDDEVELGVELIAVFGGELFSTSFERFAVGLLLFVGRFHDA